MSADAQHAAAGYGSPEFAEILAMADAMRTGVAAEERDWDDPMTMSRAMAAAATFAGMLFGSMVALGFARDQDLRRAGEGVLTNFRTGARAGKRRAARIAAEKSEGGVVQ